MIPTAPLSDATFRGAVDHGALFFSPAPARDAGALVLARGMRLSRFAGDLHPVAAIALCAIKRVVGTRDQQIDRGCRRARCDPDADGRGDAPAVAGDTGDGKRRPHTLRRDSG